MVSPDGLSHYDTLGVPLNASQKEIRTAYRELARSLHPDKNRFGSQLFKRINESYKVLTDVMDKRQYDSTGPRASSSSSFSFSSSPNRSGEDDDDDDTDSDDEEECEHWWEKWFGGGAKRKEEQKKNSSKQGTSSARNNNNDNNNDNNKKEDERREKFFKSVTCFVCGDIVDRNFYEAPCCGALCCENCVVPNHSFKCRNVSCKNPEKFFNEDLETDWLHCSKFINAQIDEMTITHACGKRIDPNKLEEHEKTCPKMNVSCFKCRGKGEYFTTRGTKQICIACNGKKMLDGLDWTKCFKCKGRGAFTTTLNTVILCSTCQAKGGLRGKWTRCFKCQGVGSIISDAHGGKRVHCASCSGKGAFIGYNLMECPHCKGLGCISCWYKGCCSCACGSKCEGHSHQFTKRQGQRYDDDDDYSDDEESECDLIDAGKDNDDDDNHAIVTSHTCSTCTESDSDSLCSL